MKRFSAISSLILGACFFLLGLLFLLGAGGQLRRVAIGAIMILASAVLLGIGVRVLKRLELLRPERLREDVLELARQRNGEISGGDIDAALTWRSPYVLPVIDTMMLEGHCRRSLKGSENYYIFPELQPRLMALFCEYCDAEYPISIKERKCPNCGGPLVMRVAVRSVSEGEAFSMDEAEH